MEAQNPFFDAPVVDAQTYFQQAEKLARGFDLGDEPFWQPPLYPVFLGGLYWLFGPHFLAYRLVQFGLGALNVVLLYLLGRRIFTPGIALAAGMAAAVYGPLIFFEGELVPPVLAILLNLSLLLFLLRESTLRQNGSCLAAGLLLGLAGIAVPSVLPFGLCTAGWMLWHRDLGELGARVGRVLLFALGILLVIGAVTLRNYSVGRDLVAISWNSGLNFYIGNNPDYPQTVMIRPGTDWYHLIQQPKLEGLEKPSEQSAYFWRKAFSFITENPLAYLQLLARKAGHFWQGGELRRNTDIYFARQFSPLLGMLVWQHIFAFPFGLLGPLALVGLLLVWKERQAALLALLVLSYTGAVVAFFATARYRLPVVPLLILLACYTGFWLKTQFFARRWRTMLPVGALLLVLGWQLNVRAATFSDEAQDQFYVGLAYARKGMRVRATMELQKALDLDPGHFDARFKLAELLVDLGDSAQAEEHYTYLMEQAPENTSPRRNLANLYIEDGRLAEAVSLFQEIVELEPENARSYYGLAGAYRVSGDLEKAEAAYRKALELDPDHFDARYNLAFLYDQKGQVQEAEQEYRQLLERQPDHEDLRNNLGVVYLKHRNFAAAAAEFAYVLERNPDHILAMRNLALAYEGMERYANAVVQYEHLIQKGEEEHVHSHLARLYKKLGNVERAREEMHKHQTWMRGKEIFQIVRRQAEQFLE